MSCKSALKPISQTAALFGFSQTATEHLEGPVEIQAWRRAAVWQMCMVLIIIWWILFHWEMLHRTLSSSHFSFYKLILSWSEIELSYSIKGDTKADFQTKHAIAGQAHMCVKIMVSEKSCIWMAHIRNRCAVHIQLNGHIPHLLPAVLITSLEMLTSGISSPQQVHK